MQLRASLGKSAAVEDDRGDRQGIRGSQRRDHRRSPARILPRQPGQMKTCIYAAELPGPPQMGGLFAACRAGFSTSPQRNREMYQKFFFCLLSNYGIMKGIKRSHVYWR